MQNIGQEPQQMQIRNRILSLKRSIAEEFASVKIFWVVVLLALACAVFLGLHKLQPADDAYITFRHVKNLLHDGRPAWNLHGNPVMGSTSPAFLFTLTLFCEVFRLVHIDQAAFYLNTVLQFLIVVLTYLVVKDLINQVLPSILAALLVGINSVNIYIFSEGFESAMLVAVLLASLYFVRTGRHTLAVLLASLAPLVRPEGILLTPLVWGYILLKKRFGKKTLLAYLLIPLTWLAFSTAYYGSPVPHPIQAKKKFPMIYRPYTASEVSLTKRLPNILSHATKLCKEQAGLLLTTGSSSGAIESTTQKCRMWVMLLGLLLAVVSFIAKPDERIIYLLYPPMFLLLYGLIGHTCDWYFPSFLTFSIVLLFSGWVRTIALFSASIKHRANHRVWRSTVPQTINIVLFLLFASVNNYPLNHSQNPYARGAFFYSPHPWGEKKAFWENERYATYRKAAEYLNAQTKQGATALISEVGVFGYFYAGDVIDAVGLCSPEALAFYPPPLWDIFDSKGRPYTTANNLTPTNMVMTLKPDFVVNSQVYIANLLHDNSPFLKEYKKIAVVGWAWGAPVLIYGRSNTLELN